MGLFDKKPVAPGRPGAAPTQDVRGMRDQGLSNNQIIQNLQRDGLPSGQIVDAMNQADMGTAAAVPDMPMPATEPIAPTMPPPQADPAPSPSYDDASPTTYDERIEEIAEAIIDEKWVELIKQVNKIVKWKQEVDARIQTIEARVNDIKMSFETLQRGVLKKVEDYDKNIVSVGTEIKAMEKVFQKVLPELTDNVNQLSRLTKK